VGALVDLPQLSVMVRGLDYWDYRDSDALDLTEPRLLSRVQQVLGRQVSTLRPAPFKTPADNERPGGPSTRVGVPVTPFPRWLRCTRCNTISPLTAEGGGIWTFENTNAYRPDQARFVHSNCSRAAKTRAGKVMRPVAVPARFVVACEAGHLDEFPFAEYVHKDTACKKGYDGRLTLHDPGGGYGGRISIRCTCGASRPLREALGHHNTPGSNALPACRGRHPHLGTFTSDCGRTLRAMVLGASNQWFGVHEKALYIPDTGSKVFEKVDALWGHLAKVGSRDTLSFAVDMMTELQPLKELDLDEVWAELEKRRAGGELPDEDIDLTAREYEALCDPTKARNNDPDFTAKVLAPPSAWSGLLESVVQVTRLRETKALVGFTRIDAPEWGDIDPEERAPLVANGKPTWLPASVTRGEGILLKFRPDVIHAWEQANANSDHLLRMRDSHLRWRANREMTPPHEPHWPGDRYLLLHTLSHLLIREITLECGYSSASISERVFARTDDKGRDEAAILLYTSASDSEGTFGGLVRLGTAPELDGILRRALASALGCSSDPLCAEHAPLDTEDSLHGAACHACLFASETSCERGNRFLDRRLIQPIDTSEPQLALRAHFT
jgi:hypothetical protein